MNAGLDAVAAAARDQSQAADPALNVFVSANAGSGKTKVLVDRVIRLLLNGAAPDKVLCITFTKAAASEMRARLFKRLGRWAVTPDADLRDELAALAGVAAPQDLSAARRLFAQALETPGGLKIQTIHAFCERVLRRFPVEAGAPPGFVVLDDAAAAQCAEGAAADVGERALSPNGADLSNAYEVLATRLGPMGEMRLRDMALHDRSRLHAHLVSNGGAAGAAARLRQDLGLKDNDTPQSIISDALAQLNSDALETAALALESGKSTDVKRAGALRKALSSTDDMARFSALIAAVFTKAGERPKVLATKDLAAARPDAVTVLEHLQDVLERANEAVRAAQTAALSAAGLTLAEALIAAFERRLRDLGAVDFADLITRTARLLTGSQAAAWVLYKLDGGVDHILVDEAQDTSPDQWAVVNALSAEFASGAGARADGAPRTVFAVGDEKQSIYGFQGADPALFNTAGQKLSEHNAGRYRGVALPVSFRSAPAILEAVDAVFGADGVPKALTPLAEAPRHRAARSTPRGGVALWPLIELAGSEDAADSDHDAPAAPADPHRILAGAVADHVAALLDRGAVIHGRDPNAPPRAITPGDIMILVRRRGALFEHLIAELKRRGAPVAGADRMVLAEQLAVQDLLGAAGCVLCPLDDLALAETLKSPLFHPADAHTPPIDDMALFDLAHGRAGSLWAALMDSDDPRFAEARQVLPYWRDQAAGAAPFAFLADVLEGVSPTGETFAARLYHRLGVVAEDPLREVLDRALTAGGEPGMTLERFVTGVARDTRAVKREMAGAGDAVRVMTVHGAKGLEAPVVILPDAADAADAQFPKKDDGLRRTEAGGLLWSPQADADPPLAKHLREAARERAIAEDLRLLYVAMTRAEEQLIVCGVAGRGRGGPLSWHGRVRTGLEAAGADAVDGDVSGGEPGLHLGAVMAFGGARSDDQTQDAAIPAWAVTPYQAPDRTERRLTPSKIVTDTGPEPAAASPLTDAAPDRYRRGVLIHSLLESLPDLPSATREDAALAWLERQGVADAEGYDLWLETNQLLTDDQFEDVFGPGSRAEAPIIGAAPEFGPGVIIEGRVDRLAITDAAVLVVDFKTDRPPPRQVDAVDVTYLAQLAGYRAVLRRLYPDRPVRCALLWTFTPLLMEIPDALLDRALPRA